MHIVTATELPTLAGKPPSSSNVPNPSPALTDEEALSTHYIPADGLSACLISPHRILVTAGACEDDRVLPFSVIRYLDLSQSNHVWTKPQHLRRKRGSTDIPVPRVEHSLTYVPYDSRLYLFGGMKIDPDMGDICKTLFAFDPRNRNWQRVDTDNKIKSEPHDLPGPRYAHSAVFAQLKERGTRPNSRAKPLPSLVIYGGYASRDDDQPCSDVHILNIRTCRWSRHRAEGTLSPGRANHAAVVTKGQRYMVIHGGNHSDDYDDSVISDVLFVYDFHQSRWFLPPQHPSSADPPTARRRHSLVNGVGRHEGSLIMYGGHLRDGNFSNDMFMCRLVEAANDDGISVLWEKIQVRGSIQRPIGGGNALKRRTVAGGCLVPIPKLRKYILLGGKGELGLRETPLLLDPYESDEIALSQSVPVEEEEEEEEELPPLRKRAAAINAANARNTRLRSEEADESDHEQDIVFDVEKDTMRAIPAPRTRRPRSALSTPPGEKPSSARRPPSISPTPSEKSPTSSLAVDNAGDGNSGGRPAAFANSPVALRLRIRSADKKKKEKENSSRGDKDFMSASPKRPISGTKVEHRTPPTKRGRFLAPECSEDIVDLRDDHDSGAAVDKGSSAKSLSYRSEFVSASELARKGKKAGRGRGRGRGRGGSARARSADDRAEEKRLHALEKLNEKNEERIAYLEAENHDLVKEISELRKDNQDLNEQHIRLLEDVRSCRVKENIRKKDTVAMVSAQARNPNGSAPGSQAENKIRPSSAATEADSLRSTIAELQAEIARKTDEKEGLAAAVQDLEEEKRDVQKELSVVKNKVERTAIDRDSYHQEMKQLRQELVVVKKEKEAAETQAQKAKEDLTLKKGDVELLKADLRVEQQRRDDRKLELSTADRKVKTIQDQLAEATKRSDEIEVRERQLKADLEKVEERNGFLQRQLDDSRVGNRKLEDEKIEISSQLECMRIELDGKVKECGAAWKDVEKSREALDRERLKRVNEDAGGEYVRMKAEFERTKKECVMLRTRCERFGRLKNIIPKLQAITQGVAAVFADDKEDEDVEILLSQTHGGGRVNGAMVQGGDDKGDKQVANAEATRNAGTGNQDAVAIPESDEEDEP